MMSDFEREERYIVIKRKHLSPDEEILLRQLLLVQSTPTIECVVVEHDWPIYEETWDNVQRLAEGHQSIKEELSSLSQAVASTRTKDLHTNNGDIRTDSEWRAGWNACIESLRSKLWSQ